MQAAAAARVVGKDGIHKASEQGDFAAVQDYFLLDASCVNQLDGQRCDWTLPSPACTAVFAMLISCSFSNRYPLHYAALEGRVAVVQLLLSCNAAVDVRNK